MANNPPQQPKPLPPKIEEETEPDNPKLPIDEEFKNALADAIVFVVRGGTSLKNAKQELHDFIDIASEADKEILRSKILGISKRVRDVAEALSSEAPSLMVKMAKEG